MKPLKLLGLAALTALLAMAFVGVTSAMAKEGTVLCTAEENPCSQANAVTSIHATTNGTPATLLTSAGNVTCEVLFSSTNVSTAHDATAEPLQGKFTYSGCLRNGTEACTITEKNGPVEITVLKEGHETGAVTSKGEMQVKCGIVISCTYNSTGLKGTALGPLLASSENGEVKFSEQEVSKVSGLCPLTAKLDITITPLVATYITTTLGYCLETQHVNGIYSGSQCGTLGSNPPKHEFKYALVYGPQGWSVTQKLCYQTLSDKGLWRVGNPTGECGPSFDDPNRLSPFELGKILVVE